MTPENNCSILKENKKLFNDQFIQITRIIPQQMQIQVDQNQRNSNQYSNNKENQNITNKQKRKEFIQNQGVDMINRHLKQFEKMQDNSQKEEPYQLNENKKNINYDFDKNLKLFNNDKSPINKQMLITRFIQRNQKELNQHYENIEDDLRKPISQHGCYNSNTGVEIDPDIQIINIKQPKQNDSFNNTKNCLRKIPSINYEDQNKSMYSLIPIEIQNDLKLQSNSKRTPRPTSLIKKTEESQNTSLNICTQNALYSQNVFNRIVLKQTERKRVKLQSTGFINDKSNQIYNQQILQDNQKCSIVKQNSQFESPQIIVNSFQYQDDQNQKQSSGRITSLDQIQNKNTFCNNRSESCVNQNKSSATESIYKSNQLSFYNSPNKQTISQTRPNTQQKRRKIYSSHKQYLLVKNMYQNDSINGIMSVQKKNENMNSQSQTIRKELYISGNILKYPVLDQNTSKNNDQSIQECQEIKQMNLNNNVNQNNIQRQNQIQNSIINGVNLNRKRQAVLKQINDQQQRVSIDKEVKQVDNQQRFANQQNQELIIEAFRISSTKTQQTSNLLQNHTKYNISSQIQQNSNIKNMDNNLEQFSSILSNNEQIHIKSVTNIEVDNEIGPKCITLNDINNSSIDQCTDRQNSSAAKHEQINSIIQNRTKKSKTICSVGSTLQIVSYQSKSPLSNNNQKDEQLLNQFSSLSTNAQLVQKDSSILVRKSKQRLSKYELIKKQIENEKKRKNMQEIISKQEIENKNIMKQKYQQSLQTRQLNQQGFSLYMNSKDLTQLPQQNQESLMSNIQNTLNQNIQDSPKIKQLKDYYDNKYGDKIEYLNINNNNSFNIQSNSIQVVPQNQTVGLFDTNRQFQSRNSLSIHNIQKNNNEYLIKEKINEMGPWASQNEEDIEEYSPIQSKKNIV